MKVYGLVKDKSMQNTGFLTGVENMGEGGGGCSKFESVWGEGGLKTMLMLKGLLMLASIS